MIGGVTRHMLPPCKQALNLLLFAVLVPVSVPVPVPVAVA